ncbi:MAG: hypothetical protein HQM01_08135 [Magnetococcales bacterium]|nr:hypothetical protein [Magnetococcales bacterium]
MRPASELCRFEVGTPSVIGISQAKQDKSVYRHDISTIDHPVARLIERSGQLLDCLTRLIGNDGGHGSPYNAIGYHEARDEALRLMGEIEG